MSTDCWDEVQRQISEHSYMAGIERTVARVAATAEIFTPTALVIEMLRRLPIDSFGPGKNVLDPACGDGQFLVAAKWLKICHFEMSKSEALGEIFGIDIMSDNVELCRARLGGGTIVVGDAINPDRKVPGQSEDDRRVLLELFNGATQLDLFS